MSQGRLARCLDLLDKVSAVLIDDEDDRLYDQVEGHLAQSRTLIKVRLRTVERMAWRRWVCGPLKEPLPPWLVVMSDVEGRTDGLLTDG